MSTTPPEDPAAAAPPPTYQPPAASPPPAGAPPPPSYGTPPPQQYGAPTGSPAMPSAAGVPRPGELLDRFLAFLIDGVMIFIVSFILQFIVAAIFISGDSYGDGAFYVYRVVSGLLAAAIYVGYFTFLESSRGQTVGKMVMKLRIFGPDGVSNPTTQEALRKNLWLAYPVLAVIPFGIGYILGFIIALGATIYIAVTINQDTVRRQAWTDKFAGGTQVMKIG